MKRLFLTFVAIAAVLLPAGPVLAASCKGHSHDLALTNGTATPGAGTAPASVTFSVRYADSGGCVPTYVSVTVAGIGTLPMSTAETDLVGGVVYMRTVALSAGSHAYSFVDRAAPRGKVGPYYLEEVGRSGAKATLGPARVTR